MLQSLLPLSFVLHSLPSLADQAIRFGGDQAEAVFAALESSGVPTAPVPTGGSGLAVDQLDCAFSSELGQPVCGITFNGRGHGMTPEGAAVVWKALKPYTTEDRLHGSDFGCLKANAGARRHSQCWIYLRQDP